MIDVHSHIINEIDDGSRSFEESISILKKMESIGFKGIIATPHYITGSKFLCDNATKKKKLEEIKKTLEVEHVSLDLYLGNEVFIDAKIVDLIKKKKIATLNDSRYVLIEFPVSRAMNDLLEILFKIRSKGYVPIIAHPERYTFLQEDHGMVQCFLEMGCLFQGNFLNIVGKYGEHAKKMFLYMLKNNQYHLLATDVHHEDDILFTNFGKVKKSIIHIIGKEKFIELTETNPLNVVNNETIEITEIVKKVKRGLFSRK